MRGDDIRPASGLRERKKEKIRLTIQRIALQLFRELGYENTTIDQIAEAAEISRASFFRYFPTKADIVFFDIFDTRFLQAYQAQPANLNPIKALRIALHNVFREASSEELELEKQRQALMLQVPELRTAISVISMRTLPVLASAIAARSHLSVDDLRVRTLAGTVIGVIISIWIALPNDNAVNIAKTLMEQLEESLRYLESDFPEI